MIQILMQRVVRSVINFIEQTQDTNLSSVAQTTKLILTQPFRTANNTIKQTQGRHRRQQAHTGTIPGLGSNTSSTSIGQQKLGQVHQLQVLASAGVGASTSSKSTDQQELGRVHQVQVLTCEIFLDS